MMPAAILSLLVKTEGATVAAAQLNAVDTAGRKAAAGGLAQAEAGAIKSSSSLRKGAKSALAFGAAFGAFKGIEKSVSTTEDLAKTTLSLHRTFGLTTASAGEWAATAEARGINNKQLGLSFKTLSKQVQGAEGGSKAAVAQFKALGVSQEDLAKHGDDLGWVLGRVSDGIQKLPPGTQRAATMGTLFGRSWQTLAPLLRNGSAAMNEQLGMADKYGATLGGSGVKSVEKMVQAQRESKLAFLGLQVTIGTTVIPALTRLIASVAQVVNWFRQHATETKALGAVLGAVTAVMVTFKLATLAATVASQAAAIATGVWTAAQWLLNAALTANPIGLVIVGIAALVAAFVVAYKKSETFRNIINTLWSALKTVFGWVKDHWPLLLAILTGPFGLAVLEIVKHAHAIKSAIVGAFNALVGAVKAMAGAIIGLGTWTINRIVDGIHAAAGALLGAAGWIKDQIVRAFHALIDSPVALGSWFVGRFIDGVKAVGEAVKNAAKWLVDKVVGAVKGFLGISSPSKVFEDIGRNMMKGLINGMGATDVMKFVGKHLGGLVKKATGIAGAVGGAVGGLFPSSNMKGGPKSWLTQALKATDHYSLPNLAALYGRMMQESGGNPRAINLTDSNAAAGHPSKGLLQTIDSTFDSYKLPGHGDIWNPVDNAIAAIRYMFATYGHIVGPSATGYARGGKVPGSGTGDRNLAWLESGEFVVNRRAAQAAGPQLAALNAGIPRFASGGWNLSELASSLLSTIDLRQQAGFIDEATANSQKFNVLWDVLAKTTDQNERLKIQASMNQLVEANKQLASAASTATTAGDTDSNQALIDSNQALIDAQNAAAEAAKAQQEAVKALQDEMERSRRITEGILSTQGATFAKALADFVSGQIAGYGGYAGRAATAGAGSAYRL